MQNIQQKTGTDVQTDERTPDHSKVAYALCKRVAYASCNKRTHSRATKSDCTGETPVGHTTLEPKGCYSVPVGLTFIVTIKEHS